jgi:hypothetical protein
MADKPVALEVAAFLDSAEARALELPPRDLQRIAQILVSACYEGLGKAPWLIDGEDVRALLSRELPARLRAKDPLGEHVVPVLEAFLEHLTATRVVPQHFEARRALDEHAGELRETLASGRHAGLAVEKDDPFVHRASKLGRNDPCSCGSGKKYKKCHGREV